MHYDNLSRAAGLITAAIAATLTCAVAAHAVQTITTPNAFGITYSLASGARSGAITPPSNTVVLVMATQTAPIASPCCNEPDNNVGESLVTIVNSTSDGELVWNGIEGGPDINTTSGFSATPGTHIVYLDYEDCVSLEVNNATSFLVDNSCASNFGQQTGNVTEVW